MHFDSEVTGLADDRKEVRVVSLTDGGEITLGYDVLHLAPPQSAPDWIKKSALADPMNPAGYVEVDKHTLRHTRFSNVFSLGDASSAPDSKTGAAIRK